MSDRRGLRAVVPLCLAVLHGALVAGPMPAQQGGGEETPVRLMLRASQLERAGRLAEAAGTYRLILGAEPARMPALLGLERVLRSLGRLDSVVPYVEAALAAEPANENVRELEFRIVAEVEGEEGAARAVGRWMAAFPQSAEPYRVWSFWLARHGNLEAARAVVQQGGARVGETRLAPYAAQLFMASGDWPEAARHWLVAVAGNEGLTALAAANLRQAPPALRQHLLRVILGPGGGGPEARRLAAELLVYWNRPEEGWTLLDGALPADPFAAVGVLRRFAERAGELRSPQGLRARGYALERLSGLVAGRERVHARLEAAQAFADAGELGAAQRLLERMPDPRLAPHTEDAARMATLIRVLAEAGRVDEAEAHFREWKDRLGGDDTRALRERLAWTRLLRGEFARAEALLSGDSTIGAEAIRGWVALYRGELGTAREHFRAAGPAAPSREEATRRARMVVLLERLEVSRDGDVGGAMLRLARGDTLAAVEQLVRAARRLPPRGGGADLLGFAGEMAVDARAYAVAEPILVQALDAHPDGPAAPGALLALARAYAGLGRREAAVDRLEQLVLEHPESAVVPQARRLLDQMRGMVPRS